MTSAERIVVPAAHVPDVRRSIARRGSRLAAAAQRSLDAFVAVADHLTRVAARSGCSIEELDVDVRMTRAGRIIVRTARPDLDDDTHCASCGRFFVDGQPIGDDDDREPCEACGAFVDDGNDKPL